MTVLKSERNPSVYKLPSFLIDFFDTIGGKRDSTKGFKAPVWQHFNVFINLIIYIISYSSWGFVLICNFCSIICIF